MNCLNNLVINDGWNLQTWDVRYGDGLYLVIGPAATHVDWIRDITWGADIEAVELDFYFFGQGTWLPVAKAPTLSEGLSLLEEKVQRLIGFDDWKTAVFNAFEAIVVKNDGGYGLKVAIDNDTDKIFNRPEWR